MNPKQAAERVLENDVSPFECLRLAPQLAKAYLEAVELLKAHTIQGHTTHYYPPVVEKFLKEHGE